MGVAWDNYQKRMGLVLDPEMTLHKAHVGQSCQSASLETKRWDPLISARVGEAALAACSASSQEAKRPVSQVAPGTSWYGTNLAAVVDASAAEYEMDDDAEQMVDVVVNRGPLATSSESPSNVWTRYRSCLSGVLISFRGFVQSGRLNELESQLGQWPTNVKALGRLAGRLTVAKHGRCGAWHDMVLLASHPRDRIC